MFDQHHPNLRLFMEAFPSPTEILGKKMQKPFGKSGGFKGTAADAMGTVVRLTQAFGPVGHGWGYAVKEARVEQGATGKDGERQWLSFVTITFWYLHEGRRGEFDQIGGTLMEGRGDDDAHKKSLTDALTKAASHIGFNADVHLGRFDDNKYVEERQQETASAQRLAAAAHKGKLRGEARAVRELLEAAIDGAQLAEGRRQAILLKPGLDHMGLDDEVEALGKALEEARSRCAPRQAAE